MANTSFPVQYLILSQAPIKESKTQFSGSTGIYLFRDYLAACPESVSSQCSAGNPVVTNKRVSAEGNTLITSSPGQSKAQTRNSHSWSGAFPCRPLLLRQTSRLCEAGKSTYLGFDFLSSSSFTHNSQNHPEVHR